MRIFRNRPGQYTAATQTTIDGQEKQVTVSIQRTEDGFWVTIFQGLNETDPGDRHPTKREAVKAAEYMAAVGWKHYPGLGYCLNT